MYILGISAYYHDSAAVLLKNGKIICAIEEERLTRKKHDNNFPTEAINWCLVNAKINIDQIDIVSYYEKPLLKFERILDMYIQTWPKGLISFVKNLPGLLGEKLNIEYTIRKKIKFKGEIVFVPHHLSHAAAAYYSSPFSSAAILTIDGVGEYQTTALWLVKNEKMKLLKEINFPHSLGLFYSTCAAYLGFKVNEDEYKLMGLAAYGKPIYLNKVKKLIDVKSDGSFNLNLDYFSFHKSDQMWSKKFEKLFGQPRQPKEKISKRHADFAKSVQIVTELIYINTLKHLYEITKEKNICIGGGVALNALANGLIHKKSQFIKSHVFGASGDSGAALGSALYTYNYVNKNFRYVKANKTISLSLGSQYSDIQIENVLKKHKLNYKKVTKKVLIETAAQAIQNGEIVGWFQGKCELGPRALGNRSILCKPSPRYMKSKVNNIKIREQFRPFAASVLQEYVHKYFIVPKEKYYSPFMNFCFLIRKQKKKELAAVVHKDNTCRIQTVSNIDGIYYDLMKEFYKISKIPCILNTSFNLKGEPIVESPEQAMEDFIKTKMNKLFIGSFIVHKE